MTTRSSGSKKKSPSKKASSTVKIGRSTAATGKSNEKKARAGTQRSTRSKKKSLASDFDDVEQIVSDVEDTFDTLKGLTFGLGALAVGGTLYGIHKHGEAKKHAADAQAAKEYAENQAAEATYHAVEAEEARRHAQRKEAEAAQARQHAQHKDAEVEQERKRATLAEERAKKLAKELAGEANKRVANLMRHDIPPLHFDGCKVACTDGICIRINMTWLLQGIVDSQTERGAIWGRVLGSVAHEWYHFLDTVRGTRASHEEEFLADGFAGKVLAQLGEDPEHFAALLRTFPQSSAHPPGQARADKMLEVWKKRRQSA